MAKHDTMSPVRSFAAYASLVFETVTTFPWIRPIIAFASSCFALVLATIIVTLLAQEFSEPFVHSLDMHPEGSMLLGIFVAGAILILGGIAHYVTLSNVIPSFVAAIFLGVAAKPFLAVLISEPHIMMGIISAAVLIILFSGGLETEWENFKALFWKIFSLAFLGLFVTAILFSLMIFWLAGALGYPVMLVTAVLLGAVLASTDPAALIPVLNELAFREGKSGLKDIAIAESALTDVTGTLLTYAFVLLVGTITTMTSVVEAYGLIFSFETFRFLVVQIGLGVAFGCLGFLSLDALHVHKGGEPSRMYATLRKMLRRKGNTQQENEEYDADAAFFLAAPVLAFAFAIWLDGSGYLAAFIVGLLMGAVKHLHTTERYVGRSIEAIFKPAIFLILGAMVNVGDLIAYAPIGIIAALVFMFIIRPIAIFLSLGFWLRWGKAKMELRDLLFLSFVRETGAIPAALLITLVSKNIGGPALVPIGMWVILGTLVLQPALTPMVAEKLGLARRKIRKQEQLPEAA